MENSESKNMGAHQLIIMQQPLESGRDIRVNRMARDLGRDIALLTRACCK